MKCLAPLFIDYSAFMGLLHYYLGPALMKLLSLFNAITFCYYSLFYFYTVSVVDEAPVTAILFLSSLFLLFFSRDGEVSTLL